MKRTLPPGTVTRADGIPVEATLESTDSEEIIAELEQVPAQQAALRGQIRANTAKLEQTARELRSQRQR